MPAAPPRRRGVLALLTGDLPYHPYDAATVSAMRERGTRRNRRRSRRADDDAEGGQRTGSAPATVGQPRPILQLSLDGQNGSPNASRPLKS